MITLNFPYLPSRVAVARTKLLALACACLPVWAWSADLAPDAGGGSVITNLQANDQVNVDGGTAWIDALTGANAGNAAAVTGAGEWAFNGGTLTYWSETAGHVGAESITLVGANNNLALTLGAHNTFTVTHG